MALTPARWIVAAVLGCALISAAAMGPSENARRVVPGDPPELLHYRRVTRRTIDATQRWKALSRKDSVLAALPRLERRDARSPRVSIDPRLPAAQRSLLERTIDRQWRNLGIDSAMIPVAVVVVLDTATPKNLPNADRGTIAFDYSLATTGGAARSERCVAIVAIHDQQLATPGQNRRLAVVMAPGRSGPALLGPCAFQARFGVAGAEVDAWLRSRSYDLAARPSWSTGTEQSDLDLAARWTPAIPDGLLGRVGWQLSPDARGCAGGGTQRCSAAMVPPPGIRDRVRAGELVMMPASSDQQWGGLGKRYLSDLVTALGPERFGRFWRSELSADAALRAVAGMPLDVWTQRWAAGLIGPLRIGPAASMREVLGVLVFAAVCVAITAWGWGRRQVR